MVIFYKKWKKYNEIQLTKNKMDLNIRKMTKHPSSPGYLIYMYFAKLIKNEHVKIVACNYFTLAYIMSIRPCFNVHTYFFINSHQSNSMWS